MALTLGTTGMDSQTEAEVHAAFKMANADAGGRWTLVEDGTADYIVIDMDSLYGPMSWLRLHSAGRKVIGLTGRERSETDYRLPKPVHANDFAVILLAIESGAPAPEPPARVAEPEPPVQEAPVAEAPEPPPADNIVAQEAPTIAEPAAAAQEPEPVPEPEPEPAVEELPPDRPLAQWLAGGLDRRVRLQRGDGPVLLIDPRGKAWHGPVALKQAAPCFEGTLVIEDFATPDDGAWEAEAATIGPAQPLSRLQWLGGLVSGHGALLAGHAADDKFRLLKWPQTEREYPKHFRIATAMMKGPATVAEIAEACGVAKEDVADFVNANLATGYAEHALPPAPEPDAPAPKPGGLFGRIRGR